MATVLPFEFRENAYRPIDQVATEAALAENISIFETLLELACRHIDGAQTAAIAPELNGHRVSPRQKIARPAECCGEWGASRCLISDYAEGGLAVVCGHPHQVGDVIRMRWKFGEHELLAEVECVVRHVTGMHIGVEFVNVSEGQAARLAASLQYSGGTNAAVAA